MNLDGTALAVGTGVAAVFSYLVGTFPSAVMIARGKGIDITKVGSGNPGASNISRALGFKWGLLVFALDAAKGAVAAAAGLAVGSPALGLVCGALSIVGHMFPVTRSFRGGKGIATGGGILLVLHPLVAVVAIGFWVVVAKVTKKASIASIAVVPLIPLMFLVEGAELWEILGIIGLGALIEIRHLPNIKRLMAGSEPPVAR